MPKLKIGILREGKIPIDRRVPFLPDQCVALQRQYPVEFLIQPSDIRCIANREYSAVGLTLSEDLTACDILIGIKEVPIHLLIPDKTYLFFSHTIKKQPHNQKLLQAILEKNIRLIDYECLTDEHGNRVIAFGRFAGIVGAYNALLIYGKKFDLYNLKRAYQCYDLQEVKANLLQIKIPNIKIAITGSGRVARGAAEILEFLEIPQVTPEIYPTWSNKAAVYTMLPSMSYHHKKNGIAGNVSDFYSNPQNYNSSFFRYAQHTDLLIAGAYWNPLAPQLFTRQQAKAEDFKITVIADVTCDIGGSIPSTIKPTTIYDPCYDYNPHSEEIQAPYSDRENVTVMAIDNLPGELPRDASKDFGEQLIANVFPDLLYLDTPLILKAMITHNGKLTSHYKYLESFVR